MNKVIILFVVCISVLTTPPARAEISKSNDYFLRFSELTFPAPSQENEGTITRIGDTILVIRRLGDTLILNKELQPLNEWNQALKLNFQTFSQRRFGERGLEGVKGSVFDNVNSKLYVSAVNVEKECAQLKVFSFKYRKSERVFNSQELIWSLPHCVPLPALGDETPSITPANRQGQPNISQAGGRLILLTGNRLLLSVGNFGDSWMTSRNLQASLTSEKSFFGKTLEISTVKKSVKIFTSGHRNIQGMVTTRDGKILATEHGPEGGDEINLLQSGKFYGWPIHTLGHPYSDDSGLYEKSAPIASKNGLKTVPPIFSWTPSIAPSQIIQSGSNGPKKWKGDFLIGTLRDQSIRRVRLIENSVLLDERIHIGSRVRDILLLSGSLYVLDDIGKLRKIDFESRQKQ